MISAKRRYEISKLADGDVEKIASTRYTNHGSGIIQFHSVVDVQQDKILPYIDEHAYVPSCGFDIREREGGEKYCLDGEGREFPYEMLLGLPMRLGGYGMPGPVEDYTTDDIANFFEETEKSLYRCLIRYTDLFPMIINTLWWKNRGHVLKYVPGASLGIHNDNDTNYRTKDGQRYFTQREVAMYQVVNALVYLNDNYEGGEFYFPYANVLIKPDVGDIVFFPANYVGTHAVTKVESGERYTYLAQYGHGMVHDGEIVESTESVDWLPPVYFPFIHQDHEKFVDSGHSDYDLQRDLLLGFHASTIKTQDRAFEGEASGTYMPYD